MSAEQHHREVGNIDWIALGYSGDEQFCQAFTAAFGNVVPSTETLLALEAQFRLHGLCYQVDGVVVQ
ncbi:hypothetical protein CPter291_3538 [Collimonas pratensis]|uniref:Uncharacterized protein n=1 Tax=Collimonas pratensis TaxID=279113 RepID=A0ABM5Z9G3_9BURK|nr:hypothetical protein CPter291_3538 [Collimonas pratensis]